ncbi:hypothetical protein RB653_009766 [Dictyostelium firmibasis]|uniref:RING zinc finger-containing protein n=1 Tax=Dictyostelium firmibasis TaxID=79012 RepID=A0AAN7TSR2_9MYCE
MDRLLNCPNCLKIFNNPRQLECNHILCTRCIEGVYNPGRTPIIKCPVCDKHSMVITSIDKSFPLIHCIEELLLYKYKDCNYEDNNLSIPLNNSTSSNRNIGGNSSNNNNNNNKNSNNNNNNNNNSNNNNNNNNNYNYNNNNNNNNNNGIKSKVNDSSPILISASPKGLGNSSTTITPKKLTLSPQRASTSTTTSSTTTMSVNKPPLKLKAISSPPITPNVSTPERCFVINDKNKHVMISAETTTISSTTCTPRINDATVLELSKCNEHDQKKFTLFCLDCEQLICSDCVINHSGHQFNKIIQEAEKRIGDIESMIITMSLCPNRLINKKNKIEKIIQDSSIVLKDTKQKISNDIDTMIENLKERKNALINQIDKEYEEQKIELKDQIETINTTIVEIQNNTSITQGVVSLYLNQVDSEMLSSSLLKKYTDLKRMDQLSEKLSNNLEQNIEWKWEPEYHFPQLFTRSNGEKTTVVYRTKRMSVGVSSSSPNGGSGGGANSSSPNSGNPTIITTPPLPPISSSTSQSSIGGGTIKKSSPPHQPQNNNFDNHPPRLTTKLSSPNLSISMPAFPQIVTVVPNGASPPTIIMKQQSHGSKLNENINNNTNASQTTTTTTSSNASNTKIQLKNPVFGKLLTRKDSVMTARRHFIYGFSDQQVEIYDNITKIWRAGSKVPKKSIEYSSIYDNNSTIYRFGGKETPTDIYGYNVDRDVWELCKVKIPSKRNSHCSVFDGIRYIYLIGGSDKDSSKLLERFDIETQQWTRLASMKFGRSYFNAFYHSTKKSIYVLDGYVNKDKKSSVEIYSIEKNQWSVVCEINQPRYLSGVSFDGSKYINIIGGVDRANSRDIKTMERFDTSNHKWEILNNEPKSLLSHTSSSMNLMVVQSPQLKKNNSFSSISSHSSLNSSSSNNGSHSGGDGYEIPTEKMQFFNTSFFDGEQFIYFYGINIDEHGPLLYKFSIKTKKFEKIPIENTLDLFSTLIFVSK